MALTYKSSIYYNKLDSPLKLARKLCTNSPVHIAMATL